MSNPTDNFDEFASDYRSIHDQNLKITGADSYHFAKAKVELLKNYETTRPLRLLDVGCGDGATELFMQSVFPAWNISGIDISSKSIEQAKMRKIPGASFYSYDGVQFPFDTHSFEIVFMAGVLHHASREIQENLMSETYRVLIPGGRFYLFEHNPYNPATRYLVKTCVFDKNARLLTASFARGLLGKNGFQGIKTRYISFLPAYAFISKLQMLEKYFTWLPLGAQYYIRAVKNG